MADTRNSQPFPVPEDQMPYYTKTERVNPNVAFEQLALFRAFEYYETLFIKLDSTSALAVQLRKVETISPQAIVAPVGRIQYWLEK